MDEDSKPSDPDELRTQIALFRYALVKPLVSANFEPGELTQEMRRISQRRYRIPATRRTRVGLSTLRRWLARFRKGGFDALKPGLRKDYGVSRSITEAWVLKAMQLRKEVPSRSSRVLVEILERQPDYPGINPRALHKVLSHRGLPRRLKPLPKKRKKRWMAHYVNSIWQGDATPGIWLPDPSDPKGEKKISTALYLWLDDVSRLIPYASFFPDEKLPRMERTLKLAMLRRGVPRAVYTDQGHVFRALQFAAALAELGIDPIKSRAYYPCGRGKIERIFGVIQTDFYPEAYRAIREGLVKSLADLNEALWAWIERIYHRRIHSETEKTPLDAFHEGLQHVVPADPSKVARAFLWRYVRTVSKNGFISLLGNTYSLDPAWACQKLELRLDPHDLSRVEVYRDRRPVARARVRELKRSTILGLDLEPLTPPVVLAPSGVSFLEALRREYRQQQVAELGQISFHGVLGGSSLENQEEQ